MKYLLALIAAALYVLPAAAFSADQWLIQTAQPRVVDEVTSQAGLQLVHAYRNLPWAVYRTRPAGPALAAASAARARTRLAASPLVYQPDTQVHLAAVPDDPNWPSQTLLSSPAADADIRLTEAWNLATDATSITVAIIDSGADINHPDLASNIWNNEAEINGTPGVDDDGDGKIDDFHGWNTVGDNNDLTDTIGHGTKVAGILSARGNNGLGIAGVCWKTRVMPIRAFGDNVTSTSVLLDAIDYALNFPEVRVVNTSWGDTTYNAALDDAVKVLGQHGVIVVTAAGNDTLSLDSSKFYPASYPYANVISVAAIDATGGYAYYSNYGSGVTVAAPGTLYSTLKGGGYGTDYGTSFATPVVSGAVALYLALHPGATPLQVKNALLYSSLKTPGLSAHPIAGGLLQLDSLLATIITAVPPHTWQSYPAN